MKIAVIVITYNDDYKFDQWVSFHNEYKNEIYKHIIVDNGSAQEFISRLENTFSDSIILKRNSNMGTTRAYNDGIKYALNDPEVDSIMLLANDIKIEKGGLKKLYTILFDSDALMISPILLEKDSSIISDFGSDISNNLQMIPYMSGETYNGNINLSTRYVCALTGGVNLAKREYYFSVGYQDENLFMYSDEVDLGIRAKKLNVKLICTNQVLSWHQHINQPSRKNKRPAYTAYLIGRNKIYLARKHFNFGKVILVFLHYFRLSLLGFLKAFFLHNSENRIFYKYMLFGAINGLINNMKFSPEKFKDKRGILK